MNEVSATENGSVNGAAMLAGGKEVKVKFLDGSEAFVFVRQLPVKDYQRMFDAIDNEVRQAEIYVDEKLGWAEKLTPQSHNELIQAGEALNKENFLDWSVRRIERKRRLVPGGFDKMIETILREALKDSTGGSDKSPPSAK